MGTFAVTTKKEGSRVTVDPWGNPYKESKVQTKTQKSPNSAKKQSAG